MAVIDGKYLSKEGLEHLWGKLKTILANKMERADVFGNGTSIPDTANLDDYKTPGAYTRDNTSNDGISNKPALDGGFGFKLTVEAVSNGERLIQKFYPSWNRCIYYVRQRYRNPTPSEHNAWSDWKPIAPFGAPGTKILTQTAIKSLTSGMYFCSDSGLITDKPSNYTAGNMVIEITNTITSTRRRIKIYPASSTPFWICAETGTNTWSKWYMFEGVEVPD
jgi:hypothetical protein